MGKLRAEVRSRPLWLRLFCVVFEPFIPAYVAISVSGLYEISSKARVGGGRDMLCVKNRTKERMQSFVAGDLCEISYKEMH